jgi:hypothetical protein
MSDGVTSCGKYQTCKVQILTRIYLYSKKGDDMKIAVHIPKEQKQQLEKMKSPRKKKRKKKENLSFKDWQDIMGMNRDIYSRHNGAVRRK